MTIISILLFLLGLVPLWIMLRLWQNTASLINGFAFTYFFVQHISFGLGGLLVVLFDDGYQYVTLHGTFSYAGDVTRLMILNLVALYAGLVGSILIYLVSGYSMKVPLISKGGFQNKLSGQIEKYKKGLKKIGIVSLSLHALFLLLQKIFIYTENIDNSFYYFVQVINKVTPASFFFIGLIYRFEKNIRRPFILYVLTYGLLIYLTGGRGPVLFAVLMFLMAYLSISVKFIPSKKSIIISVLLFILVPLVSIQSENIRQISNNRDINFNDFNNRLNMLLGFATNPQRDSWGFEYTPSFSNSIFRFGARILEVSAYDVIRKTPEEIPYSGLTPNDIPRVWQEIVPLSLRTKSLNFDDQGVMILKDYGWSPDPAGGTSFPVTLLADSWRRFGWFGVFIVHLLWSIFLLCIPFLLAGQRIKLLGISIAGPCIYILSLGYTEDWVGLIGTLPRLLILSFLYGIVLYIIARKRL